MLSAEAVCLGVCDVVRGDFELASKNHQVGKIDKRGVAHFKSPFNESRSLDATDSSPEALGTISNLANRVAPNPTASFQRVPQAERAGRSPERISVSELCSPWQQSSTSRLSPVPVRSASHSDAHHGRARSKAMRNFGSLRASASGSRPHSRHDQALG